MPKPTATPAAADPSAPGNRDFSAVVLAAGRSSRMGQDKALLERGGQPLWRRQRDVLSAAGAAEIFLSARDNQPWTRAATPHFDAVVRDVESDCGPLAGIAAALDRSTQPSLLVLAIDLPEMTAEYLARLIAHAEAGRGVVPAWPDGRTEPLCALYPRTALALAMKRLERRQLAMQDFVAALVASNLAVHLPIAKAEAGLFTNWNEPSDAPSDVGR